MRDKRDPQAATPLILGKEIEQPDPPMPGPLTPAEHWRRRVTWLGLLCICGAWGISATKAAVWVEQDTELVAILGRDNLYTMMMMFWCGQVLYCFGWFWVAQWLLLRRWKAAPSLRGWRFSTSRRAPVLWAVVLFALSITQEVANFGFMHAFWSYTGEVQTLNTSMTRMDNGQTKTYLYTTMQGNTPYNSQAPDFGYAWLSTQLEELEGSPQVEGPEVPKELEGKTLRCYLDCAPAGKLCTSLRDNLPCQESRDQAELVILAYHQGDPLCGAPLYKDFSNKLAVALILEADGSQGRLRRVLQQSYHMQSQMKGLGACRTLHEWEGASVAKVLLDNLKVLMEPTKDQ
jgi:hypothetical protein